MPVTGPRGSIVVKDKVAVAFPSESDSAEIPTTWSKTAELRRERQVLEAGGSNLIDHNTLIL